MSYVLRTLKADNGIVSESTINDAIEALKKEYDSPTFFQFISFGEAEAKAIFNCREKSDKKKVENKGRALIQKITYTNPLGNNMPKPSSKDF